MAASESSERCDVVEVLLALGVDPEQPLETLLPQVNAIGVRGVVQMMKRTQVNPDLNLEILTLTLTLTLT